jgi:hypothetical protein
MWLCFFSRKDLDQPNLDQLLAAVCFVLFYNQVWIAVENELTVLQPVSGTSLVSRVLFLLNPPLINCSHSRCIFQEALHHE